MRDREGEKDGEGMGERRVRDGHTHSNIHHTNTHTLKHTPYTHAHTERLQYQLVETPSLSSGSLKIGRAHV